MNMRQLLSVGTVVIAIALSGCAAMQQEGSTDNLVARLAVQQAVLRVAADGERAERIRDLAISAQQYIGDDRATLGLIDEAIRAQVRWESLNAADAMLINTLLTVLRQQLEARFGAGVLSPEHWVVVGTVVEWVIEDAAFAARS